MRKMRLLRSAALCAAAAVVMAANHSCEVLGGGGDGGEFETGFEGNTYVVVKERKTWEQAADDATARGGHLVSIGSQAEQDAVMKAIRDAGVSSSYAVVADGGGAAFVWIGGKASASRSWTWHGSGTAFWNGDYDGGAVGGSYANWGGKSAGSLNEPDDFTESHIAPNGQNAAAIGLASWPLMVSSPLGVAGEWNDIAETNKLYYVVEIEGE